ncbi:acyl-CoA thioesterase, partial [Klebsiella pneumoniae]|uniref:acyl-CoA thioesterase n=2 Tax=Pseudomonadota TaxID=1224 RepID=UPI001954E937
FMRAGDPKVPIIYEVDRIRDGASFTTRRVVAIQHGHAIFSLEASFQIEEKGLEHQKPIPLDVLAPEKLMSDKDLKEQY